MSFSNVMVYVDPQQQQEGPIRVAEAVANRFGGSLIGVSAFAVEPTFASEGVIIQETTDEDLKRMKADLAAKEDWFQKVVASVHSHESDAGCLMRLAKEEGADLIVTGGYGHSRLGEWMFGGTTRGLLQEAPICLLMSH